MDISTASGSNELPDLETSASPIDPALTGHVKGKRKQDGDDGDGDDSATTNNKKRRNRKVRTANVRHGRVLTSVPVSSRSLAPVSAVGASSPVVYPALLTPARSPANLRSRSSECRRRCAVPRAPHSWFGH